ncbi:MAG: carboxypeptidase regulatory-like domain-containing protein [Armatimonadota bacterium]
MRYRSLRACLVFDLLSVVLVAALSAGCCFAAPTVAYDFLANAGSATWSNPMQAVAYGGGTAPQGIALIESGALEDGRSYSNYLLTLPDSRSDVSQHSIRGSYTVAMPDNATNIYFTATVGCKQVTNPGSEMTFKLVLYRYGQCTTLCSATERLDGTFATMSANLSGYEGETLNLYLWVDLCGDPTNNLAVWRAAKITAETPVTINARDYGAIPNDGSDDYQPIQNAIDAAINLGSAAKVSLENGEYRLSNRLDIFDAPNGLILKGGTDTRFTMTNRNSGVVYIGNCSNAEFSNITVDYNPLTFTQGTISSTGSGYSILNIDPGYPDCDDGWLWVGNVGQNAALLIDPNIPGRNKLGSVDIYQISNVVKTGNHQFKLYGLTGAVGDRAVFQRRVSDCLSVAGSGQVLFRNVNLYSGSGLTTSGGNTEKIFYRGCSFAIKPETNRMHGPSCDGAHMQGCKNGPEIVNCLFEGLNDDAVNFYGVPYSIQAKYADNHYAVNPNGKMITIGDTLVFFRPSNGTILGHAVVTTEAGHVTVNGYNCMDVTIDPPISGVVVGDGQDQVYDESWMSGNFLIANSTFRNFRGQLRIKTHDGVITNNTFQGLSGCGLHVQNIYEGWIEGLQAENITISNNSFIDCGISGSFTSQDDFAVVRIAGVGQGDVLSTSKLPRNISIVGNSFTNWQRHAISAGSAENLDIHGNNFNNSASALPHPSSGHMSIMFFDNCTGVKVYDNTVSDSRPGSQINGKLFASRMNAGNIITCNNSYNVNTSAPEITWTDGYDWETGVFRMSRTLAGDWSDAANPVGGWRYGDGSAGTFNPLSIHQSSWVPADLGPNQPAWANTALGIPGWCKSVGHSGYDFPAGRVGCHGPAIVRWVSSRNGIIQISGGVWQMRNLGRTQTWELRSNAATFTGGALSWGPTSASPLNFTTGSGGSAALTRTVLAGDIIELYIHKAGESDDFVGTDMTVTYLAWDSKTDWSDTPNPNGVWSYGGRLSDGSFDLLSIQQSAWLAATLGVNQPAWADGPDTTPGWCRSNGTSGMDFPAGRIGCHGPAIARWISNFSGTVEVSGGLWLMRDLGRDQYWELRHNGVIISAGKLTWGPNSSSPLPFATGTGGLDALTLSVQPGGTVELHIYKAGTDDDLVGVDFTINKVDQVNGSITGTVTDSISNAPISGASVQLVGTSYSTTTVSIGAYSLTNIVPGFYMVRVSKTGCYTKTCWVNVVVRTNAVRDVQLVSVPSAPHTWDAATDFSALYNPNGPWEFGTFSVSGSSVTYGSTFDAFSGDWIASDWDNTPGWFQSLHNMYPGATRSNGTFYLGTVPSGRMASYVPAAVKWTAPRATTVNIHGAVWNPRSSTTFGLAVNNVLQQQATITGKTSSSPYSFSMSNVVVNAGDTVMLLNGPAGDYMGFDFSIAESTVATVSGTVRDPNGNGLVGALVSANPGGYSTTSGTGGTYTLSNLPPGTYTLAASRSNYYGHTRPPVALAAGQRLACDFMLSKKIIPSLSQPVGLSNKHLGGGNWTGSTPRSGVTGGVGLNNIGLLVKVWGKVTFVGSDYLYIDDGSYLNDGSGRTGVKVQATGMSLPSLDKFVNVSGISWYFDPGTGRQRMIVVRGQEDIIVLN